MYFQILQGVVEKERRGVDEMERRKEYIT